MTKHEVGAMSRRRDCCDRCTDHDHASEENLTGPKGEELCCKCGKDINRTRSIKADGAR